MYFCTTVGIAFSNSMQVVLHHCTHHSALHHDGGDAQTRMHNMQPQTRRHVLTTAASLLAMTTVATPATHAQPPPSYDSFAPTYDALDGGAAAEALGFVDLRRGLLQRAQGNVLEVRWCWCEENQTQ